MNKDFIIKELLTDPKHKHLYMNSAMFRANMMALIDMLPIFIEGLALQSNRYQEEFTKEYQRLLTSPPQNIIILND